ncbi:MAG: DUF424 family protein [Desulfurococcaceae archaeon]
MKVFVKLHKSGDLSILAVCDENLLGKRLIDDKGFAIYVDPRFYGGELVTMDEAFSMMSEANCINMVGNDVVREAIKRGLVREESVIEVCGVLHAQIIEVK